jgi:hypothetical protein
MSTVTPLLEASPSLAESPYQPSASVSYLPADAALFAVMMEHAAARPAAMSAIAGTPMPAAGLPDKAGESGAKEAYADEQLEELAASMGIPRDLARLLLDSTRPADRAGASPVHSLIGRLLTDEDLLVSSRSTATGGVPEYTHRPAEPSSTSGQAAGWVAPDSYSWLLASQGPGTSDTERSLPEGAVTRDPHPVGAGLSALVAHPSRGNGVDTNTGQAAPQDRHADYAAALMALSGTGERISPVPSMQVATLQDHRFATEVDATVQDHAVRVEDGEAQDHFEAVIRVSVDAAPDTSIEWTAQSRLLQGQWAAAVWEKRITESPEWNEIPNAPPDLAPPSTSDKTSMGMAEQKGNGLAAGQSGLSLRERTSSSNVDNDNGAAERWILALREADVPAMPMHEIGPSSASGGAVTPANGTSLSEPASLRLPDRNDPDGRAAFMREVADRMVVQIRDQDWNVHLSLSPEGLGGMTIQLAFEGNALSATIAATHSETRALVQEGLPQLRNQLESAGIAVGEVSVGPMLGGQTDQSSPFRERQVPTGREDRLSGRAAYGEDPDAPQPTSHDGQLDVFV